MSFSQFAGTAIVPTLSRVVLALAFVSVGYNKVMTESTFDAAQAKILQEELGVQVTPAGVAAANPLVVPVAFRQDEQAETGTGAQEEPGGEKKAESPPVESPPVKPPPVKPPPVEPPPVEPAPVEPAKDQKPVIPAPVVEAPIVTIGDGAQFKARSLHQITLMCHAQKWPSPTSMAWAAALTELIGGGLLLLGFLTRLWGLALAGTMGVAFYLVSMQVYQVHTINPFEYATDIGRFNTTFNQLGLFVLALGLLFTGAGPASLDRLLFRRGKGGDRGILKPEDAPSLASGRPM